MDDYVDQDYLSTTNSRYNHSNGFVSPTKENLRSRASTDRSDVSSRAETAQTAETQPIMPVVMPAYAAASKTISNSNKKKSINTNSKYSQSERERAIAYMESTVD